MTFRSTVSALALCLVAACTQGSDIASPGATTPTTPPAGGGGGGGGGTGTAACPTGFTAGTSVGGLTTCLISGAILNNLTLTNIAGIAYEISGRVDVGADVGADGLLAGGASATLTIQPGVTLFGTGGEDHLVVNRGSRIVADGDVNTPIIFTSSADLVRQADSDPSNDLGGDQIGEWGGLVVLGQAPISRCSVPTAAVGTNDCTNAVEGVSNPNAIYGGSDANDDSGILNFVQVRFAGNELPPVGSGNELNGITFGGVGAGTIVDGIQVHNNSDDGIEMFGGTVNIKHLVLTGNDDDSLDTDNGYVGSIQYAVVTQRAAGGDNINEASSTGAGNPLSSNFKISNFTFVGNRSNAFRLNSGTISTYVNGVVNYGKECFRWQDAGNNNATFEAAGDPSFRSVIFDCALGLTAANSSANGLIVAPLAVAGDANNSVGLSSLSSTFFPGPNEENVTPVDPTTLGAFFEPANYIGAFGPSETPTQNWATGWTFGLFPDPSCPVGTTDSGVDINGQSICQVSGVITSDLRLTQGNFYELINRVDVGVDTGPDGLLAGGVAARLTIEAGVTVYGDSGDDHLVVNRGSQIFSNGTRDNPVVFTSENDLTNSQPDATNAIGEWGGLVILGQAPISRCSVPTATVGTNDCTNAVEGVSNPNAIYGGSDAADNSGSLNYTLVKFAGNELPPVGSGNELNGITFGGVGSGTLVDFIQVHNNADDGIEMFGGTVNIKHLVLTGNDDDSIDTDNGYVGNMQFAIVTQRTAGGDNINEASSTGAGNPLSSNFKISNFTFVGNRSNAFRLNSGTIGRYVNGVVSYGKECFRWQDAGNDNATYEAAGDPSFDSVLFDCTLGLTSANSSANGTTVAPLAVAGGTGNSTATLDTLASTFVNGPNEALVTPFDVTTLDPFFEAVDYIGAVKDSSDTWWQGWSCGLEASDPC